MRHFILVLASSMVVGCGNTGIPGLTLGPFSCTYLTGTVTQCVDYTGSSWTGDASKVDNDCQARYAGSSTHQYNALANCASANPSATRVGVCAVAGGQSTSLNISYYSPTTSPSATSACATAGGTYTAGR